MKLYSPLRLGFSIVVLSLFTAAYGQSRVIEGQIVSPSDYPEVMQIKYNESMCSAVAVGPRTLLMTAHCAKDGARIQIGKQGFDTQATVMRSPLFPKKDHDFAVAYTDEPLNVQPAIISREVEVGTEVSMAGYGCNVAGGSGEFGQLRLGTATITKVEDYEFVTKGSAVCYGDSGAPAFIERDSQRYLLGIGSKGNIKNTSYFMRMGEESILVLRLFAEKYDTEICGINANCDKP